MKDRIFVDTNVLVYSRDASEPLKQEQALHWIAHLWEEKAGRLSYQVLNEFYVTVTQKLQPGMDAQSAREDVRDLLSWRPISLNTDVLEEAWRIQDRYMLSWWDALIVSAAHVADCDYLLTEDLQENQVLAQVKVINPFNIQPENL